MLYETLKAFLSVFVVVSPIGAVPLFLGMTQADQPAQRRRTAWFAAVASTVTLATASLIGQHVFDFFGVSLDAFRIAGGILLFFIALDFVQVRQARMKATDQEYEDGVQKEQAGIIPLAIPMLSGPGSIATVMVLGGTGSPGWQRSTPLLLGILLVGLCTLMALLLASRLQRYLTPSIMGIVLRLEGLLLAAIAVQMVVTGMTNLVLTTMGR